MTNKLGIQLPGTDIFGTSAVHLRWQWSHSLQSAINVMDTVILAYNILRYIQELDNTSMSHLEALYLLKYSKGDDCGYR